MANNHYIPRFLTKPWEVENRKLCFYNFRSGKIEREPSVELFATEGVYSDRLEKFLNQKIELIIASQRNSLSRNAEIRNPKVYQALQLLFWTQGSRIKQARSKQLPNLEAHADLSPEHLMLLARSFHQDGRLFRVNMSLGQRLFFPSSGHFPVMFYKGRGRYQVGLGLPLHPQLLLLFAPHGVSDDEIDNVVKTVSLMNYSVGLNPHAEKVVVPPELLSQLGERRVAEAIRELRRNNQFIFQQGANAARLRKEIDDAYGRPISKRPFPD